MSSDSLTSRVRVQSNDCPTRERLLTEQMRQSDYQQKMVLEQSAKKDLTTNQAGILNQQMIKSKEEFKEAETQYLEHILECVQKTKYDRPSRARYLYRRDVQRSEFSTFRRRRVQALKDHQCARYFLHDMVTYLTRSESFLQQISSTRLPIEGWRKS